jgi:RsiW-degrading membrane proteinase PrsW (M82 family)/predicted nucleic acid-binding Zn ribbon protein
MSTNNPYKPAVIRLETPKVRMLFLLFIISALYAIIVLFIITSGIISDSVKLTVIYSYAIIAPLFTYGIWLLFYWWKANQWPQNEKMFGGPKQYMILFFLLGVCVINWAAYWNTGIFSLWMVIAIIFYIFTRNELGAAVIFTVGAFAITPALVEEFNKSFPSILAFFIVLQRGRDEEKKNKGMLGNELNGFLIGVLIGLAFESIETASYIVSTILSGGSALDIYLQVTLRNWGPIHILGGALGGFAAAKAERLFFERNDENLPRKLKIKKFLKIFLPIWAIPVILHFLWNSSGVWIFLIYLALGIQDMMIIFSVVILIQLSIAVLSYYFLFHYLKQANNSAEVTLRCSESGMIVAHQAVICDNLSETLIVPEERKITSYNFCPNCGIEIDPSYTFCTNCGLNIEQFKRREIPNRLYERFTRIFFIISIIVAICYLLFSVGLFLLYLIIGDPIALPLFFTQTVYEIITGISIIYASLSLRKLKKTYNGKKSLWGWLFLIYNMIAMTGAILAIGMSLSINIAIAILIGQPGAIFLPLIIVLILYSAAIVIIVFLRKVLLQEKQLFQYQRWF